MLYRWGAQTENTLSKYLKQQPAQIFEFNMKVRDYHADSDFSVACMDFMEKNKIEAIISFDYFPIISLICSVRGIPYISWIYDCPMLTLESLTLSNDCNFIFCFDRAYAMRLTENGAKHCFHLPLAGDPALYDYALSSKTPGYRSDISFVGNLYNDSKNRFRTAEWNEYEAGYLDGIIRAQAEVYGCNFIRGLLSDELVSSIIKKCDISLGKMYRFDAVQLSADVINHELSAEDREHALAALSRVAPVDLYTGSELPASLSDAHVTVKGYADYETQMPLVFNRSRINLNCTSRTIESGVPLRIFDILSCGGFCITNYQPEIDELFENGSDLVMYGSMDELSDLAEYYLQHEDERKEIATRGYTKIKEMYSYQAQLDKMFQTVAAEI